MDIQRPLQKQHNSRGFTLVDGWSCSFVTRNAKAPDVPGVERIDYRRPRGASPANHHCTRYFERAVREAHGVYEAMKARPEVRPDLVVAHSGFGSSLFLPHLYDAPIVNFFEYYYRAAGGVFTFRPHAARLAERASDSAGRGAMDERSFAALRMTRGAGTGGWRGGVTRARRAVGGCRDGRSALQPRPVSR